jgi:hypothetical protein
MDAARRIRMKMPISWAFRGASEYENARAWLGHLHCVFREDQGFLVKPWWSSGANLQLSLWRQTTAAIQQQSKSFVKRVSAVSDRVADSVGSGGSARDSGALAPGTFSA